MDRSPRAVATCHPTESEARDMEDTMARTSVIRGQTAALLASGALACFLVGVPAAAQQPPRESKDVVCTQRSAASR